MEISLNTTQIVNPKDWLYQLNNNPNGGKSEEVYQPQEDLSETFTWNYDNQTGQAINPLINLYQGEHLEVDCKDCYLMLSIGLDLNLVSDFKLSHDKLPELSLPTLQPFSIGMYGKMALHMDWEALASYQISIDKNLKLLSFDIAELDFCIGLIPVEIDVLLQIWVEIAAQFDASVNVSVDFNVTGSVSGGISYDSPSNTWTRFGNRNLAAASFDPSISVNVGMYKLKLTRISRGCIDWIRTSTCFRILWNWRTLY